MSRRTLLALLAGGLLCLAAAPAVHAGGRERLVVENRTGADVDVYVWRYNGVHWEWSFVTRIGAGFGRRSRRSTRTSASAPGSIRAASTSTTRCASSAAATNRPRTAGRSRSATRSGQSPARRTGGLTAAARLCPPET